MKTKPRWLATERPNQVAILVQNVSNPEGDSEVFMVELHEDSFDKITLEACIEAARRIVDLLDGGSYFSNRYYSYTRKTPGGSQSIDINIPSQRKAKSLDNRFELFAELLAMNGINFRRPAMGVYAI